MGGESPVAGIRDHRDLLSGSVAMDLVLTVYRGLQDIPRRMSDSGLSYQARRAAISIPLNIARGTDAIIWGTI